MAGGGGLITLPAYLSTGLDPALLLGTNKLSSSIGTIASAVQYKRKLGFSLRAFAPAIAASLLGSWLGARLASRLDPAWIRPILLVLMPAVAWLVYSRRHLGREDHSHRFPPRELLLRSLAVAFPIGLYDGFFGPGTGTFLALGLVRFCGHDLLAATARAKVLNLVSNVAALAAFLAAGGVEVRLGLAMGGASLAGHWAGSHVGLKKGAEAIRPAVLFVLAGLFLKLLFS